MFFSSVHIRPPMEGHMVARFPADQHGPDRYQLTEQSCRPPSRIGGDAQTGDLLTDLAPVPMGPHAIEHYTSEKSASVGNVSAS